MINDFYDSAITRGFWHQSTDDKEIRELLQKKTTGYIGFDCTSDSLHVGSLLPIMLLRLFQKCGHKPIILVGGGTTLIGDPSGKDETRKILSDDDIKKNKQGLNQIFKRFLSFDRTKDNCAELIDNLEWLEKLNLIPFLRDIGSKFSVNKMLGLESIKQRLAREQHLSFLEFNYSIMQAYDFMILNEKYNCQIQFGGSDQWGNIVSGIDLVKKIKNLQLYGLTSPLVTTSSGNKMGKTADGAVWLSEEKFSVGKFWQYWRNTSDKDVIKFLKLFTEINISEINKFIDYKGEDLNKLKVLLANEVTALCHGLDKTKIAEAEAKSILSSNSIDSSIIETCEQKIFLKNDLLEKGVSIKQILVELNLSQSNAQAKRLVDQGAVKINKKLIADKELLISKEDFLENPKKENSFYLVVFVGKKKYGLVELIT